MSTSIRTLLYACTAIFTAGLFAAVLSPSPAHAALPANEVWREQLLNQRVGYGRLATGGAGGSLCTVNTLANSGGSGQAGSLRHCMELSGPQWIIFSVSGVLNLTSRIQMSLTGGNHDKTIDGRGANIVISAPSPITDAMLFTGLWPIKLPMGSHESRAQQPHAEIARNLPGL
jgi:hypothetical protein